MFLVLYILVLISSIQTCPLKIVDLRSGCYCGIEIDGTNYIQCHPYSLKQIPQFTRSYIYDKLNLSNNAIQSLTNTSFHQLKVKRIYLDGNPIRSLDKQTFNHNNLLQHLEELHISTLNTTVEFLCYGTWKNLRILKLSGFNLYQFQFCFDKLVRLEKLIIEHSHISIVSHHIYKLPLLSELSLVNNHLKSFYFDEQYVSSSSSSIRLLNLTFNQLRTIPNDLNLRLPHLTTLDLSHNVLTQIPMFNQMTTLNMNLSFNLINSIPLKGSEHFLDLSFNPICTLEPTIDLSNIVMDGLTALHCDCRLGFFLKDNATNQLGNETICSTPEIFNGVHVKDLTYEQLMSTCSGDLPKNCKEVMNFPEIQQYARSLMDTNESTAMEMKNQMENTTNVTETAEKLNNDHDQISSFRLTSFYTLYENNDLFILWDFDTSSSSTHFPTAQLQIVIEQQSEIIRRSQLLSPYLKKYILPHIPSNKNYYVCLLLTRSSYGTDKYCREIYTSTNQTVSQLFSVNRSIIVGFMTGTILTTCLLVTLAFICRLYYKRKHSLPLFHHHEHQQRHYMYINRNDDDGIYSHSIVSSPLSKYQYLRKKHRRQTYLTPIPPWYPTHSKNLSTIPRSPCCFLQYHHRTLSSSTTTNRMTSVSSEYSNGIDKEQMTSTSLMSNTSLDDQQSHIIQNLTKHVYEELGDTNSFL